MNASMCYEVIGNDHIIKEVKEKDAGVFAIALSNQKNGLQRHISCKFFDKGKAASLSVICCLNLIVSFAFNLGAKQFGVLGQNLE